jgi:tetratricopeptide (TPR) repeat protein
LGVAAYVIYKKKLYKELLWIIPVSIFIPYGYTSLRTTFFGYLGVSILLGWLMTQFTFRRTLLLKFSLVSTGIIYFSVLIWATNNRLAGTKVDNPEKSVTFLKKHIFTGNMFNQYDYGGYLEYQLYQKYKVFIDARTDLFLCCELPDYFSFQKFVLQSSNTPTLTVNQYFEKYHISFVILEVKYDAFGSRLYEILQNDPEWVLVYWDDGHVIFVRKGTNKPIVDTFGTQAVSPFSPNPIKNDNVKQAFKEYSKMIMYTDSAVSRNALGYIYFISGDIQQAKGEFTKAIQLDATYESGYSNLAEILFREKEYSQAIALYTKAISLNPNRPILYIRLGQLYQMQNDIPDAENIWQQGLDHTSSGEYRQVLQQLLQSIKQ